MSPIVRLSGVFTLLLVFAACISVVGGDSSSALAKTRQMLQRGEVDTAVRELSTLCYAKSVGVACRELATLTFEGRGVVADRGRALALLRLACLSNDPEGCIELRRQEGDAPTGEKGPRAESAEFARAIDSYRESCNEGYRRSCLGAGLLVRFGWGTPANAFNGKRFIQKACTMGDERACELVDVAAVPE